jgi:hypothetical protein
MALSSGLVCFQTPERNHITMCTSISVGGFVSSTWSSRTLPNCSGLMRGTSTHRSSGRLRPKLTFAWLQDRHRTRTRTPLFWQSDFISHMRHQQPCLVRSSKSSRREFPFRRQWWPGPYINAAMCRIRIERGHLIIHRVTQHGPLASPRTIEITPVPPSDIRHDPLIFDLGPCTIDWSLIAPASCQVALFASHM